jgi:uncharacterized protein (DUF305 family)
MLAFPVGRRCFVAFSLVAALVPAAHRPGVAQPHKAALAAEAPYLAKNNEAMNRMMAGMAVKPAGKIDHDFAAMMIPHHQGAIDMARLELSYGHNQLLLRIAQTIIVGQLQEIAAMHQALGERPSPTERAVLAAVPPQPNEPVTPADGAKADPAGEAPFLADNKAAMNTMMAGMAAKPTGDVDHDFVAMMVPHHQGAIDMAEAELRHGSNIRLRGIAQEIIVDQGQEIQSMRLALGEKLPPDIASPTNPPPATAHAPAHQETMSPEAMPMSPNAMMHMK